MKVSAIIKRIQHPLNKERHKKRGALSQKLAAGKRNLLELGFVTFFDQRGSPFCQYQISVNPG